MNRSATRKSKITCARKTKFCSVCGVNICSVNLDRENNFLTLFLIRPVGAWFVLRGSASSTGPDSSYGPYFVVPALIRLAGPCLSRGALIRLAEPWLVIRALIRRSGPWSVLRGPDSYCEALIRSVVPDLSRRALIRLAGPDLSCGALIRPTGSDLSCGALIRLAGPSRGARVRSVEPWFFLRGPDPSRRALKPDKSTSARAQAGLGGPASVWRAKNYDIRWSPVIGLWGGMARMSPWDRHCHGVHFQTRLFPCTIAYICQKRRSL